MGLTMLWPLALLVLIPAIILLYILKQKAKPADFSSVMLWQEVYKNLEATKPWEKLRKNLLLFLQILIVFLLAIAMAGPWINSLGKEGSQVVLVIDNSASMGTRYGDGQTSYAVGQTADKGGTKAGEDAQTRLEAAKESACDYVDGLAENTKVSVIAGNQSATLVIGSSTDRIEIKNRIRQITQTSLPGDLSVTLGLVSSCMEAAEDTDLVFYTDTAFDMGSLQATVESFYSEQSNLALDSLSYTIKDQQLLALATVTNDSGEEVTEDVNLYGIRKNSDGDQEELLDIASVTVKAGETASVYFTLDSSAAEEWQGLCAQLNEKDGLAGDNERYCALEQVRQNRILLVTESNVFLEKAFSGLSGMEVYRTSDLSVLDQDDSYDLYIFDGLVPEKLPATGSFLFLHLESGDFSDSEYGDSRNSKNGDSRNLESGDFLKSEGEAEGKIVTLTESSVTDYVADTEIGVNETLLYQLPSWGESFMSCGSSCAGFCGIYDGHRMAAIGFDLHQTDFALTAQFPVLIANLSDYLLSGSLLEQNSYTAGESMVLYGSSSGADLLISQPDGSCVEMSAEEAYGSYYAVTACGLYQVGQELEDGSLNSQTFAVNFPAALESQVESADSMTGDNLTADGRTKSAGSHTGALELRRYLLLLALLLLLVEWFVYVRQMPKTKWNSRRMGELALRLAVFCLTVSAVFGISIRKQSKMTTTVFLVDLSDSLSSGRESEETFLKNAIADMPDKNQAAIILFGEDSKIEQFVSDKKSFTKFQSAVVSSSTNLEQAVQSALALYPDETAKRMVLLTDGQENEGSVSDLTAQLASSGVELKVVKYENTITDEVYVSGVSLPDTISQGDSFRVNVEIYSTDDTQATVTLYSGRTLKGQKEVLLEKGTNQLVFTDTGVEKGLRSYRVTVEADKDTVTVNNTYNAFTTVEAPPTLLLVEGTKGEGSEFEKLLSACNYNYETVTPEGVPNAISDLLRYDSVILLDVFAPDLRDGFLDTLDTYVKDYAGGCICIGGDNAYALGQYQNTTLEDILPVSSELQGEKQVPSIAMVMVIDHSGSMESSSTGKGNVTCLDVAKNAAIGALDSLRTIDQVGVIDFDDSYSWAVELQTAENTADIAGQIAAIPSGGGTSIYPALAAAVKALETSDAAIKHVVLLTDGEDGYREYDPLLEEAEEEGITISTVAIGSGSDTAMLSQLASAGGGRYYYSDAGTSLPRIFVQEVYLSTEKYRINEEFTPLLVNSHEITDGVFTDGCPSLLGYIATTNKSTAIEILESDQGDPILSVWQYGIGRAAAWTSDGTGEWTGHFVNWDNYVTLWRNILDWTISDTDMGDDTLSVEQQGEKALLTYTTDNYSAETKITAVITDDEGNQKNVTLSPSTPGTYTASVDLTQTGVYSVSLRNAAGEEVVKSINTATAIQYSREYRFADVSSSFDSFLSQLSGRIIEKPEEVWDTKLTGAVTRTDLTIWFLLAAILLFMADVICRRMSVDYLGMIRKLMQRAGKDAADVADKIRKGRKLRKEQQKDLRKEQRTRNEESDWKEDLQQNQGAWKEDARSAGNQTESGAETAGRNGETKETTGRNGETKETTGRNGETKETAGQKTADASNTSSSADKKPGKNKKKPKKQEEAQTIDTAALLKKKKDRQL